MVVAVGVATFAMPSTQDAQVVADRSTCAGKLSFPLESLSLASRGVASTLAESEERSTINSISFTIALFVFINNLLGGNLVKRDVQNVKIWRV